MKKYHLLLLESDPSHIRIISDFLKKQPTIDHITLAQNAYQARDIIVLKDPDLMVMNLTLPKLNGLSFLKQLLPQYPFPIITYDRKNLEEEVVTSGGLSFIQMPLFNPVENQTLFLNKLYKTIISIASIELNQIISKIPVINKPISNRYNLIAIGASTGGTEALKKILTRFPQNIPPTIIVQHMPPMFTEMFAKNLDRLSRIEVLEGKSGLQAVPGRAIIARGDQHMKLQIDQDNHFQMVCSKGDRVSGHRPSVDILFQSVARYNAAKTIAILLTGMGRDGAHGLLKIKQSGGYTIAQDEASSIVYGMPGEAAKIGAHTEILPLDDIFLRVMKLLKE